MIRQYGDSIDLIIIDFPQYTCALSIMPMIYAYECLVEIRVKVKRVIKVNLSFKSPVCPFAQTP